GRGGAARGGVGTGGGGRRARRARSLAPAFLPPLPREVGAVSRALRSGGGARRRSARAEGRRRRDTGREGRGVGGGHAGARVRRPSRRAYPCLPRRAPGRRPRGPF